MKVKVFFVFLILVSLPVTFAETIVFYKQVGIVRNGRFEKVSNTSGYITFISDFKMCYESDEKGNPKTIQRKSYGYNDNLLGPDIIDFENSPQILAEGYYELQQVREDGILVYKFEQSYGYGYPSKVDYLYVKKDLSRINKPFSVGTNNSSDPFWGGPVTGTIVYDRAESSKKGNKSGTPFY